jgi:diaminohydroxyphosphoribosylaminopyrimidine deaminase/5-amino-6-(5-phosphoribosylamino)uracil reductase
MRIDDAEVSGTELDRARIDRALELAASSVGLTEPNPRVGCVIGFDDGSVCGEGATQQAGGPHAEVMALRDAAAKGNEVSGATAWVTLEPCAHHGRTPPCCDALIRAGIRRVVVGALDPFPRVNGAGIDRLRAAGLQVQFAAAPQRDACREVNIGFFSRVERGRPWVRVKVAASMDGRTALLDGRSQWITGEAARRDGHAWRRRASAVLSGIGTVLADDPRLDVRLVDTPGQPWRIVLDTHWRTPTGARLLQAPGRVLVVGSDPPGPATEALEAAGAELLRLPAGSGGIDLAALWPALAGRGLNELHFEAGSVLNGYLAAGGWVDEWLLYLAPRLLGEGRGLAHLGAAMAEGTLSADPPWTWIDCSPIGTDVRLRARRTTGAQN